MSSNSTYYFELLRTGFWIIIGVVTMCVIYAIRSTCVDIANSEDGLVITASPNRSTVNKGRPRPNDKDDILKPFNGDGTGAKDECKQICIV